MCAREHTEFPARLAALRDTGAFAQVFCERNGIDRHTALRLTLVIEELFTNTVQHGYRAESDLPVRIELSACNGGVAIFYEDAAPRYDPLARSCGASAELDAPFAARSVGGLGLYLISQLVADARYAYENGCNRIWLIVPEHA